MCFDTQSSSSALQPCPSDVSWRPNGECQRHYKEKAGSAEVAIRPVPGPSPQRVLGNPLNRRPCSYCELRVPLSWKSQPLF